MRLYVRTSKHTGGSLGCLGTLYLALFWMCVIAIPFYVAEQLFSTWWSAALTVAVLVGLLALYGRAKRARRSGTGAH